MKTKYSFDGFNVTQLQVPSKDILNCVAILGWTILNGAQAESKQDRAEMDRIQALCEDIIIPENMAELIKKWIVVD